MSTANRYVAVCDVLGFKNIIQTKPLSVVVSDFMDLRHSAYKETQFTVFHVDRNLGFKSVIEQVDFAIFSDTILLWTEPTGLPRVENFFDSLGRLIAISFLHDLPLRIGIAYGESYIDAAKDVFLGQPIVNAHLTEQEQQWIGGACHKSCENEKLFLNVLKFVPQILVKYPVPKKGKYDELMDIAVAWPTFEIAMTDKALEKDIASCKGDVKMKYQNTLNFFNSFSKPDGV